jgi:phosphohistidine phosphatase SixA
MNLKKILCCFVYVLAAVHAQASELSDKLQSTEYVLLMRHTLAPGVGDPAGYSLEDCKTQRNLSVEGRQHAGVVGDWLRKQGVTNADVHSSAWCRCKDTAELLKFNSFQVALPLASFFDEMHLAKSRTQALEQFIAEKLKTKGHKALILVTHHVNIHAFMGENIASGDMVLARVDARGKMRSYQLIARPSQAQL